MSASHRPLRPPDAWRIRFTFLIVKVPGIIGIIIFSVAVDGVIIVAPTAQQPLRGGGYLQKQGLAVIE